jgi:methionyl-tRNA synthetase
LTLSAVDSAAGFEHSARMAERFYITTPIYYPNAEPHLGTVYTTVAADVLARYHRLKGDQSWFVTGTDEHGIKMVKTAAAAGIGPHELADNIVSVFQTVWKEFDISHDDFVRTSSDRHKAAVEKVVKGLRESGDIYLGSYSGWYDEGQEEFVTETEAKAAEFKSVVNGKPLVRFSEPSYFFRLSKYHTRVLENIEKNPQFIQPETRRNEILSKLRGGVEDLSISRATLKWGIPMPHDPEHVIYVWIDALTTYITGIGFGGDDQSKFNRFWPVDVHLIGKEISWFHAVYWPAMLMSLGLPLPKRIYAHGWWTSGGRKMSKSLGNFVDLAKLRELVGTYSLDALRYYLLRAAPFGSDLDFTEDDFHKAFNELANVIGNGLNRTVKMIGRYCGGVLPATGPFEQIDRDLLAKRAALPGLLAAAYEQTLDLQQCAMLPMELARATNGYIDATEPFKLAKDPAKAERLRTVLAIAAQAIGAALVGLLPILPHKAAEGVEQLGVSLAGKSLADLFNQPSAGVKLGEGKPLFPKVETV